MKIHESKFIYKALDDSIPSTILNNLIQWSGIKIAANM